MSERGCNYIAQILVPFEKDTLSHTFKALHNVFHVSYLYTEVWFISELLPHLDDAVSRGRQQEALGSLTYFDVGDGVVMSGVGRLRKSPSRLVRRPFLHLLEPRRFVDPASGLHCDLVHHVHPVDDSLPAMESSLHYRFVSKKKMYLIKRYLSLIHPNAHFGTG